MKLEQQLLKLEQQLLINREARSYWQQQLYWPTGNEVRTTTTDQQGMKLEQSNYWSTGMKLEQQLLINMEWSQNNNPIERQLLINRELSYNNNYWPTGNEARTTPRTGNDNSYWSNREWS